VTGTTRTGLALLAAAVAFAGVAPDAEAQRLGRLFTTPEQRSTLDELRYQTQLERPEAEPEPKAVARVEEEQPQEPGVSRLTVNGIVRRSRGPGTVWVNGALVERGGLTAEGLTVEDAGGANVHIRLPSGARTIALKPGQRIDVDSGAVLDSYEQPVSAESPVEGRSAFPDVPMGRPPRAARDSTSDAPRAEHAKPEADSGPESQSGATTVLDDASVIDEVRRRLEAYGRGATSGAASEQGS